MMVRFDPPLRPATPEDAPALTELVVIAGEGLPLFAWQAMAEAGEDPWDVGRRRELESQSARRDPDGGTGTRPRECAASALAVGKGSSRSWV